MNRPLTALATLSIAGAGLFVSSGPTSAQVSATMDVALTGQGSVADRGLIVRVPVQLTCTFPDIFDYAELYAVVRQAQGRSITVADGYLGLSSSQCDGAPHTVDVTILASSAPFHGGPAVVSVAAYGCSVDPATYEYACASDGDGPKAVSLKAG